MLRDQTLAVLGAGHIGRALVGGLLRGDDLAAGQIRVTRRDASGLDELRERLPGVTATTDNVGAVRGATVVLVSVKPQNAGALFDEVRDHVSPGALVLSTLAGVTTRAIAGALGQPLAVVRAMPNTPALVDEAATAIAGGAGASGQHVALAREVFAAVGIVEVVPEYLMDAVTGLSGSGPAYVFMVIEALTDAGVKQGLPRTVAARLAAQTVLGAARLAIETGRHPAILRDEVTTPGGTTISAVAELEKHGLRTMLIDAVGIATERSRELSVVARDE
ncbi:pyrroline-5-carboxylate reductase [Rubrivirga litoralis]|uniref:Pyrroline-5-carboxylate reductase n=1 Tax=Rubrivirga litoralis TaxID=3075598 RepID=A0ABU3BMZ2_9BACT|nr:pyrroline-5-carboxylate reductase [Rubrivirga sp. F394]MDT0630625.1 pyrroline-5-carboxylate reductase [Rubrivirga sp. F394]